MDESFETYVRRTGMASEAQIEAARRLKPVPLAEALVKQGAITAAQREAVEKKLEAQREASQQIGGFKILRKLGEGGMGAVYLAEGPGAKGRVAIKVLPKERARDPEFVKRFHREAQAATKLDHPNIARAFSAGEDRGRHFIVMEYCEGTPLGERLAKDGALPIAEASRLVTQIAEGLCHAHANGVIHRDIKPDNLVVTPEAAIKILDFGLAKDIDASSPSLLTLTGAAVGTPLYISPEQARGQKDVDGRADLYSLGATYFHLVTGEPPFQGASAFEIVNKHLVDPPPDPRDRRRDVPAATARVIQRMMAKRPEDRYRDCGELIADLKGEVAAPKRAWKILAAVAAVLLTIWAFVPKGDKPPPVVVNETSIDLLKLVDPERDAVTGRWRRDGSALVTDSANPASGSTLLVVRHDVPEEYDLELEVERVEGSEALTLALVLGGRQFGVMFDGFAGDGCGVCADEKWTPVTQGKVFTNGKPSTVVCSVRKTGFTATVDGARVIEWTDVARLSMTRNNPIQDRRALAIGTVRSFYRITKLRLKP